MGFTGCTTKPSHIWVYQTVQETRQNTIGFHRLHNQAISQLGLLDCPAKPIHNWVYQDVGNQANTLLGLSGYSTKPANSWVYQTTGTQANTVTFPQFPHLK